MSEERSKEEELEYQKYLRDLEIKEIIRRNVIKTGRCPVCGMFNAPEDCDHRQALFE